MATTTVNFYILGAEKCGTTSLYQYLSQHPDITFSNPKEPIFFEAEYEKGLDYFWDKYFQHYQGEQKIGEARHRNLYLPYVPRRIYESTPDAKFLIILRNPVERAFSHWINRYVSKQETLSFNKAIKKDFERINEGILFEEKEGAELWRKNLVKSGSPKGEANYQFRTYIDTGYYSSQINRYLELFPPEQFKIILLEDLQSNPIEEIRSIFKFLEVDESKVSLKELKPANQTKSKSQVQDLSLGFLSRKVLQKILGKRMTSLMAELLNQRNFSEKTKGFLIEHYQPHNHELEKLINRDLSHWNNIN